jgi:Activator of Hsp90 ATPase homolog 1-like protein
MSAAKRIQFTTEIGAPATDVWRHITSPESYRRWTSAFAEGSHFEGSWTQGSKIRFLAPSGDGMVAEIAESREYEFISIRHLGFLVKGVEDTTSETVTAWAPAYENYTLAPVPGGTKMVVDQDVAAEWEEYMKESWPKALVLLKELSESSASAT